MRCFFGAAGLSGDQLRAQLISEPRDDLVLRIEEVGDRRIETLGPEMRASFSIDELDVDTQPVTGALNAAFQYIGDVQLAHDLLQIEMFSFIAEGSVAPNDE